MQAVRIICGSLPSLLAGAWMTAAISLGTLALSTLCALFLYAIIIVTNSRVLGSVVRIVVWTVRGVPLVVVIFLVYYGLAVAGVALSPYQASIASLTVFFTAGMYEVLRGAFESVPSGQWAAAFALGMSRGQALRRIIIPQALRRTIAPWTGEFAGIIKGSTLLALVSISELTLRTREIVERTLLGIELWSFAALLYFAVCFAVSALGTWVEQRTTLVE